MTNVLISKNETTIAVKGPYHPDFPWAAKRLGGKWRAPEWVFDVRDEDRVRDLCRAVYGTDGEAPGDLVTLRVTWARDESEDKAGIYVAGRCVAYARGRDTGARLGDGVVLLDGVIESSGSVKNWTTKARAGAVVEIRDIPHDKGDEAVANQDEPWTAEIIDTGIDVEALRAERGKLAARIAEIDAILEAK